MDREAGHARMQACKHEEMRAVMTKTWDLANLMVLIDREPEIPKSLHT